jgi:hypothetical protein
MVAGANEKQLTAMNLYAALLEEIKIRIASVENMLNNKVALHPIILREACFLQLRMLCEAISLGCLIVHGDIGAAEIGKLRKEWSADAIVKTMAALDPTFFPRPHKQERVATGRFHMVGLKDGFLTREELQQLNGLCGNVLHRGSLKNFEPAITVKQVDLTDVLVWLKKIGALLNIHVISLFEGDVKILCVLRNMDDKERVQVAFASAK